MFLFGCLWVLLSCLFVPRLDSELVSYVLSRTVHSSFIEKLVEQIPKVLHLWDSVSSTLSKSHLVNWCLTPVSLHTRLLNWCLTPASLSERGNPVFQVKNGLKTLRFEGIFLACPRNRFILECSDSYRLQRRLFTVRPTRHSLNHS